MNITTNKFLHYLLIILLMMAPLRSVFAMQQSPCDMEQSAGSMSQNAMSQSTRSMAGEMDHDMHHGESHKMSQDMSHDMPMVISKGSQHNKQQCCCCEDGCLNACDMSVNSSLIMQLNSYTAIFVNISILSEFSSDTIIRNLSPPSRPPALLS